MKTPTKKTVLTVVGVLAAIIAVIAVYNILIPPDLAPYFYTELRSRGGA